MNDLYGNWPDLITARSVNWDGNPIGYAKWRLAQVERELAKMDSLAKEATTLKAMLAAAGEV